MKKYIIPVIVLVFFTSCKNITENIFEKIRPVEFTYLQAIKTLTPTYIVYIDENTKAQKIKLSSSTVEATKIALKKNYLTPILMYTSNIDESPKGCIYPLSTTIDTHGGFAAWILYKMLLQTNGNTNNTHTFLSHFNWTRFISTIKEYEDPWVLDQDRIIENIADKTFNVYSIKEKSTN